MSFLNQLIGAVRSIPTKDEISAQVRGTEYAQRLAKQFQSFFDPGDEHLTWLMSGRKREFQIMVEKSAVRLLWFDRTKEPPMSNSEVWYFGTEGYADLPGIRYQSALVHYLLEEVGRCPTVRVIGGSIYANSSTKRSW